MDANSATKKPIGIVEPLPSLLWKTALEPQIEATATAIHIAQIASDAHISRARSSRVRPRSGTVPVGGCEIVDISHLPSRYHRKSRESREHRGQCGQQVRIECTSPTTSNGQDHHLRRTGPVFGNVTWGESPKA